MSAARVIATAIGLAAPPVAVIAVAWPDDPSSSGADADFLVEPVTEATSVTIEVAGSSLEVTLRPDPSGACLEITSANGGSESCGPLASFGSFPQGPWGSSDGATTTFEFVGLTTSDVESVVVTLPDDTTVDGVVAELPGRVERVYVAVVTMPGERLGPMRQGQIEIELLDAEGEVVQSGST